VFETEHGRGAPRCPAGVCDPRQWGATWNLIQMLPIFPKIEIGWYNGSIVCFDRRKVSVADQNPPPDRASIHRINSTQESADQPMSDTVNPYRPGQPADNPRLFFGRRQELTSIRDQLLKGRRIFVVSAAPRMGRSSLLRQLPAHLPEGFVPVQVELSEEEARRLDWLLWRIADAVGHQVGRQLGVTGLEPLWADFEGHTGALLDTFWPDVRAVLGERCLVLLLDDLDALIQEDARLLEALVTVLADWRDRDGNLAVVATSSIARQDGLLREYPRLFAGALSYVLGPLNSEEATRLITWPVDGVLTYDYGVARRMIEITSGHPYYLQLLCFEVFNRCAPTGWVNQHDLDLVVENLIRREIADFRQVWDESSPPEQAALAALVSLRGARGVATAQEVRTLLVKAGARVERGRVAELLDSLTARGILERLGASSYRFRVALLRDWLSERVDLQQVVRNTRWTGMDKGRQPGGEGVTRLPTRRQRRRPSPQAGAQATAGKEEMAPPARRPWLWIGVGIGLAAILLLIAAFWLLRPASVEATPTALPSPSSTVRPMTAPPTRVPTATSRPSPTARPTLPPSPTPTLPPSPTPPLVISRPVPSIAYQAREAGEKRWSVYVMNSDGSNRIRLGIGQSDFLSAPAWSPDGSRIAFVSDRDGQVDIWVMGSDGRDPVNLTSDEARDHSPAWSPDGEWIAFASVRESLYWELYRMRPDGSEGQRLTWWEDASDLWPSWSPDGTRLAFASRRDGNWEIYIMDRDGGNLVRLTDHPADDTNPAWSPDGGRIAFVSNRDGFPEIYVMPVIGGEAVNLSRAPFSSEHGPTWSPDGGRIAFYSDRDGEWDIYVMAADGSDVIKLTGDTSNDQVPAWRP